GRLLASHPARKTKASPAWHCANSLHPLARSQPQPGRSQIRFLRVSGGSSAASLLPGLRCQQLPIRITRTYVTRKRPNIGDVGYSFSVAVNNIAILVACHRNKFRLKANGDLGIAPSQFGSRDVCIVNRHETTFDCLATLLALAYRIFKTVIDLACEQILQGASVTLGVGVHDHFISCPSAGQEMLRIKIRIGGDDGIKSR